jgi:hypothetical protein
MMDNIKKLWSIAKSDTKKKILDAICNDSELRAKKHSYVQYNWIYKGNVPEEKQEYVLKIMQNAIRIEVSKTDKTLKETY